MGLFSRKKRQDVDAVDAHEDIEKNAAADGAAADGTAADGTADDGASTAVGDEGSAADVVQASPEQEADEQEVGAPSDGTAEEASGETGDAGAEETTGRGDHLAEGPFDESDAPEEDRIDLGGLQVPTIDGMELRMEVDQRTSAVTGANLVIGGSSVQVQAFAAPKSRGLWDDVRTSLRDSVVKQGGTAETRPGAFGTELITRLPVKRADGRTGYRPARFIGIDGRRWFLRAILTGKALSDAEQARAIETVISRLVVVRGGEAMAPQELIPLNLPGQRPGLNQIGASSLDPLARGPEITQIG